jgi:hypothetical protein
MKNMEPFSQAKDEDQVGELIATSLPIADRCVLGLLVTVWKLITKKKNETEKQTADFFHYFGALEFIGRAKILSVNRRERFFDHEI